MSYEVKEALNITLAAFWPEKHIHLDTISCMLLNLSLDSIVGALYNTNKQVMMFAVERGV
jgi:hypothetical protein